MAADHPGAVDAVIQGIIRFRGDSREEGIVTKTNLACMSLVGVLPAGFLVFLLAKAFMYNAEDMSTVLQVLSGMTLLAGVSVVLVPAGILISKGKSAATPQPVVGREESDDAESVGVLDEEHDEEAVLGDAFDEDVLSDDGLDDSGAFDDDGFDADFEVNDSESDELYAEGDDDDFEGFEMEVFDDDEDK